MNDDIEFEEALPAALAAGRPRRPGGVLRRRFIQASLAVAGGVALPMLRPRRGGGRAGHAPAAPTRACWSWCSWAAATTASNTLAPISGTPAGSTRRCAWRPGPAGRLAAAGRVATGGCTRSWPRCTSATAAGRVALVQGAGLPAPDLSHFTATAKVDAGPGGEQHRHTAGSAASSTACPTATRGLRAMSVGTSVPMYLIGQRGRTHVRSERRLDVGGGPLRSGRRAPVRRRRRPSPTPPAGSARGATASAPPAGPR